jgi:hypothetical protein
MGLRPRRPGILMSRRRDAKNIINRDGQDVQDKEIMVHTENTKDTEKQLNI